MGFSGSKGQFDPETPYLGRIPAQPQYVVCEKISARLQKSRRTVTIGLASDIVRPYNRIPYRSIKGHPTTRRVVKSARDVLPSLVETEG